MSVTNIHNKLKMRIYGSMKEDKPYYMGAVCYDKKYVPISYGYNSYSKTHPLQKFYANKSGNITRCYLHAEISALIKAQTSPYGILVMRYTKSKDLRMAKPCKICEMALKEAGIQEVWYSNEKGGFSAYLTKYMK